MSDGSIFAYSLLAGLAPLISSSVPFFLFRNRNINANVFHILLCVSAGLLFAVATLELVPESIDLALRSLSEENNSNHNHNHNSNHLSTTESTNTHHLNKIMEIDFDENEFQVKKENLNFNKNQVEEEDDNDGGDDDEHNHEDEEKKDKFKIPMYGLAFGFLVLIVIESLFSGHEGGHHSHSHLPSSGDHHHGDYELLEKVKHDNDDEDEDTSSSKSVDNSNIDIESADSNGKNSSKNRIVVNGSNNSSGNSNNSSNNNSNNNNSNNSNNSNGNNNSSGSSTSNTSIHISKGENDSNSNNNSSNKSKLTITTFIALSIHSFVDGVVISSAFSSSQHVGARVALAIVIHKIPDGLVLSSIILSQKKFISPIGGNQRLFSNPFFYFLLISCMTPLGSFISSAIFGGLSMSSGSFVLGFGAGTFLYITSSAILPEILSSQNVKKSTSLISILIGYLLFIFLDSTFHGAH